jgi:hypothetical protein
MHGAIPPLPQYVFMVCYSVEVQVLDFIPELLVYNKKSLSSNIRECKMQGTWSRHVALLH